MNNSLMISEISTLPPISDDLNKCSLDIRLPPLFGSGLLMSHNFIQDNPFCGSDRKIVVSLRHCRSETLE